MSTSSVSSSYSSSKLRIGGLSTGIDTDSVIKSLMKAESIPLDKLNKDKTKAEWKRDAYRDVTSTLSAFQTEFLDVLSTTNMKSQKQYKILDSTVTNSSTGASSGKVSVATSSDAQEGSHTLSVQSLAKSEQIGGEEGISTDIKGSKSLNWSNAVGKSFVLNIDGTEKTVNVTTGTDSISKLQTLIDNAVGKDKINVSEYASSILQFKTVSGSGVNSLVLKDGTDSALDGLGFGTYANFSNRISKASTLEDISTKLEKSFTFNSDDEIALKINDVDFTFSKDDSLSSMMNEINSNASAGAYMRYDQINDKVYFESKTTGTGSSLNISETGSTFLKAVGYTATSRSAVSTATLKDYTSSNGKFSVMVDGVKKDITLDGNYTSGIADLKTALKTKIESSFSGLSLNVSESGGKLSLAIASGGSSISFGEPTTGNSALSDLGLTSLYKSGEDAKVTLDGNQLVRASNTFTVDGVSYTAKGIHASGEYETIGLNLNVDTAAENITKFVDKYNEVISKLNDKLTEEYDRDYQPLTSEERSSMSETDITLWETKAKTGLLRNDSTIESVVSNFRTALYESVEGISKNLSSIGITTGNYASKGKLNIDETKLKDALRNDSDAVMSLFSQSSKSYSSGLRSLDTDQRKTRYKEEGLAYRISDIIDDNISIVSDRSGNKGTLLEKAGKIGDSSEYDNMIYKEIAKYKTEISDMNDKLSAKETAYYKKFTNLETVTSKLNSQGEWLQSQLASM